MGLLRSNTSLAALSLALAQDGTNFSTTNPSNNLGVVSGQTPTHKAKRHVCSATTGISSKVTAYTVAVSRLQEQI
jgi:hypothetical protein